MDYRNNYYSDEDRKEANISALSSVKVNQSRYRPGVAQRVPGS